MNLNLAEDVLSWFYFSSRISPQSRARLAENARFVTVPPGMFRQEGDACEFVSMPASGRVRVSKCRPSGREITLYTFGAGEICVLEVLAVLTGMPYRAVAAVEEQVSGVTVPAGLFRELVDTEKELRAFLFKAFESRLAMALELVGDVALDRLYARLAALLLRMAGSDDELHVTHHRIAGELACAREAVTRLLGTMERAGVIELGRGRIRILDAAGLAAAAGKDRERV